MTRTDVAGHDDVPERFQVDFTGQTLLGTYRIDRRLADGGMGSVYLAEDTNLGRRVVVKVPHARFLGEPGFRARFRREIEELVRLEHPNVVRILARGEQDGIPFFVLQYLGGGSLEDRLTKGSETPEGALAWLGTIADTLDFVHGRGVVHRDVKPANILFDEAGHVFLSDFGVVKALGQEEAPELTAAGTGIGSPVYMAPEQGMGRGVSPASDQYALASALYEALAGAPPFGRGSVVEILVRKGREDAPPLRRLVPALPEACEAAVARGLAREPADRFPTCRAFAEAYRHGVGVERAAASPRSRARLLVALIPLVALLGAAVLTRGFGLWEKAPPVVGPPAASTPAPRVDEPLILLRLREPGAEPRRVLRWSFEPGRREARRTRMVHKQSLQLNEDPIQVVQGVSEHDYDAVVSAVEADGRARLEWTFQPLRPLLEGGATADSVAMEQKVADALGTLSGTSRMTPKGVSLDTALRSDKNLNPAAVRLVTANEETMKNMAMPLPDDPVGIGAKWETTQIKELLGIRYQEVAKYEVLAIDGDHIRFKFLVETEAPDQALKGQDPGSEEKMRVKEFTIKGSGESVIDLKRVIPIENTVTGEVVYVVEVTEPEQGMARFHQSFDSRTTAR
jgi:hypothetical protein